MQPTLQHLFLKLRDAFREAKLAEPETDARYLVAAAVGVEPKMLPLHYDQVSGPEVVQKLEKQAALRLGGMPVGRILGQRDFWGLTFTLSEETLEPRPDTEVLVEATLDYCLNHGGLQKDWVFADIGSGTGAIAIALLTELPNARAVAVDVSEDALLTTRRNAISNGVGERLYPVRASYLTALAPAFDFIVSNPPYIKEEVVKELSAEVKNHDPIVALSGGPDGLDAYRELIGDGAHLLRQDGALLLEIGWDQQLLLRQLIENSSLTFAECRQDLGGNDRVVLAKCTQPNGC
ncbi:peptide chain release factor N(5)-glutamine methyltransferase [Pseudovibrio exalbescens]|uniref:peptide chain release factor N(5)-glutamine methyltransferase n=1 Tax=Pseudovibrio exalbescens TaxID=197461 RepID=UPI0023667982|nr:peptide chain release factor N(5)-glutamine methyltransferase [Pseudovibrio exalbescens]MDD7909293.1 peptide chain release factor N(5)-glutamine methyltransferase [Pseudovibrio exalbescens]